MNGGLGHGMLGLVIVVIVIVASKATILADGEWSSWRGGTHQGALDASAGPIRWTDAENIQWSTTIPGSGHSSPIVSDGRAYVTTAYTSQSARTQTLALAIIALGGVRV